MTDSNNVFQKAVPFLTVDNGSDREVVFSPFAERSDPLLSESNLDGDVSENEESTGESATPRQNVNTSRPIRRSASDAAVATRSHHRESTTSSAHIAIRFQDDENHSGVRPPPQSPTSLHPPRHSAQRSTSSSRVELRSRYHDPTISSASLHRQLIKQTRPTGLRTLLPWQVRCVPTAENLLYKTQSQDDNRDAKRVSVKHSTSDLEPPPMIAMPRKHSPGIPLKPCMKRKAKSTTTTPPGEVEESNDSTVRAKTLRRVKTVDFEEIGWKPLFATLPMAFASKGVEVTTNQSSRSLAQTSKTRKIVHVAPSFSSMMSTTKSSLAEPAVTRTDVHVIAIVPSWGSEDAANEGGVDPATPTMQIVESKNGCYEVIWDDVPTEHSIRRRRRSSSASHALETVSSIAIRGLERVNTKLTDWSGTWNSPSESFKPTIVVFPDDDGRAHHYDCSVEEDEDLVGLAPPNTQRTSAAPSSLPSRSTSAPITRAGSQEDIHLQMTSKEARPQVDRDRTSPTDPSPLVSDPEGRPGRLIDAARRRRLPTVPRKLSNIDDSDLRFRGHRDSVTIAHSRLIDSGGILPDLFAYRDSVSMAKKRMHARNHATSAAREISRTKEVPSEAVESLDDDDGSLVPLATVKEHAAQALKNSSSASMLCPQKTATKRHIRIVE